MISSWLGLSGPGPALHSADHRERGRGVWHKNPDFLLFIVHCSLDWDVHQELGQGPGSAATNDVRSVSLSSEPELWVWAVTSLAKHWHQVWPWHRGAGAPPHSDSWPDVTAITISISQSSDLMNNTPITGNNALSLAAAKPGLDPRPDGDREIWNCLSSEINGSFLSVLRNSSAQKVHRSVPIHICPIVF